MNDFQIDQRIRLTRRWEQEEKTREIGETATVVGMSRDLILILWDDGAYDWLHRACAAEAFVPEEKEAW